MKLLNLGALSQSEVLLFLLYTIFLSFSTLYFFFSLRHASFFKPKMLEFFNLSSFYLLPRNIFIIEMLTLLVIEDVD